MPPLSIPAAAQDDEICEPEQTTGPVESFPSVGAMQVTRAAPVRVRYSSHYTNAVLQASALEGFQITREGDTVPVAGSASFVGLTLFFEPTSHWEPDTTYQGIATGFERDLTLQFTTGDRLDETAPVLLGELVLSAFQTAETCEAPNGGVRIDATFDPAVDDGPPGDIEYQMYLTHGPTVEAPELRGRTRNTPAASVVLAMVLTDAEARSTICAEVLALDGVGRSSHPLQACIDPLVGNYFQPLCSIKSGKQPSRAGAPWKGLWPLLLVLAMLLVQRRRFRFAQHASPHTNNRRP